MSGTVKVLVTSGRTLSQGRAMEKGKLTEDYEKAVEDCNRRDCRESQTQQDAPSGYRIHPMWTILQLPS